jgi:ubiquitin carboxyl-terminal hydrolase 5/13
VLKYCSHYVAFALKKVPGQNTPSWFLFNDEKVVRGADVEEMKQFAYIYFFTRI